MAKTRLSDCLCLLFGAWMCLVWGSPMGCGGRVGLELGCPEFPSTAPRPLSFPHEPSGVLSWGSPQWGGGLIQGTFLTRNHAKNGVKHIVVPCRFLVDLVLGWNVAESTVRLSVDVTCVSRRTHACAVRFTPHGRSPCFLACMSGLSCAVHMPEIVRCTLHRNSWY